MHNAQDVKDLVNWTDAMSVGLEEIDAQHMYLIDRINELWRSLGSAREDAIVLDLLVDLRRYTERHFADEEMLMKAFDYPHLAAHERAHGRFVERVRAAADDYTAGKEVGMELLRFLSDWLQRHIKVEDRQYAVYLERKRVGRFRGSFDALLRLIDGAVKGTNKHGEGTSLKGLDMKKAIAVHSDWNRRLEAYLRGEGELLDPNEVAREDLCILGSWLEVNVDKGLDELPEFQALRDHHRAFHQCAGKVVSLCQRRNIEGARDLLRGELRKRANAMRLLIIQFYSAYNHKVGGSKDTG